MTIACVLRKFELLVPLKKARSYGTKCEIETACGHVFQCVKWLLDKIIEFVGSAIKIFKALKKTTKNRQKLKNEACSTKFTWVYMCTNLPNPHLKTHVKPFIVVKFLLNSLRRYRVAGAWSHMRVCNFEKRHASNPSLLPEASGVMQTARGP